MILSHLWFHHDLLVGEVRKIDRGPVNAPVSLQVLSSASMSVQASSEKGLKPLSATILCSVLLRCVILLHHASCVYSCGILQDSCRRW